MSDDGRDTSPTSDLGSQLAQLADLHGQGVLSDEEFSAAKQRIIEEKPRQETEEPPVAKPTPVLSDGENTRGTWGLDLSDRPIHETYAKTRRKQEVDAKKKEKKANKKKANKKTANKKTANMRFTKAALAVAIIVFLTIGLMPGLVQDNCAPALIAAMQRGEVQVTAESYAQALDELGNPPPPYSGSFFSELGPQPTSVPFSGLYIFDLDGNFARNDDGSFKRDEAKVAAYDANFLAIAEWNAERDAERNAQKAESDELIRAYDRASSRVEAQFSEDDRYVTNGVPHPCNDPARNLLLKAALIGAGFVAAVAAAEYVLTTGKEQAHE